MSGIVSAEQVIIHSIEITSEKFASDKKLLVAGDANGAGVGVELVIYENITMPYLTGALMIQDDNDIHRTADIRGTERVRVVFRSPQSPTLIEKIFIISNTERTTKVNDELSMLTFELIEDIGYFDKLQLINKAYSGSGSEIIRKILKDNTNKTIKEDYFKEPNRRPTKYIATWQTPLTVIHTLMNFMSTDNGMPYFFFSSITSDQLIFTDLESILARDSFNKNFRPFTYSKANVNKPRSETMDLIFNIDAIESYEHSDTLTMAQSGALGSLFDNVDAETGLPVPTFVDMVEQYGYLNRSEILRNNERIPIDSKFRELPEGIRDQPLNAYISRKQSTITSSPYDDYDGLMPDFITNKNTIVKNNYLKHLANNSFNISVPGLAFGVKSVDRSVGHKIDIVILKDGNKEGVDIADEKRSGSFVMLSKKHVFNISERRHTVDMQVGRIADPARIAV